MKLIHNLTFRLMIVVCAVTTVWAILFYHAIVNELNDEQDDYLEDFAEQIIRSFLRGDDLPDKQVGSNNQYFLRPADYEYAENTDRIRYIDEDVYIEEKKEYEPARSIYYIFCDDNGAYYEVGVSMPTIDKNDMLQAIYKLLSILLAALLLSFALISFLCVRRTMRPLNRVLDWMNSYRPGEKNQPLQNRTNIVEFRQLGTSVGKLTERVEQYEQQQQLLISNASHEIQTPLAICTGRLENLLEEEKLSESQANELSKTLVSLRSLSALNKSLLMLCRIENGQYADNQPADLCQILRENLPDFQDLFVARNLVVSDQMTEPFVLSIDIHLARILILNLLKNAFVHTPEKGSIVLSTAQNNLSIANTSLNGPLPEEDIFQPFYHSNNAHSTGLGLPLALAVARRYNLDLRYIYEQKMHVFRISLKKD